MVYPYNGILFSDKKKGSVSACYNMTISENTLSEQCSSQKTTCIVPFINTWNV